MQNKISILSGDCVERMKELPDAHVDVIFADPPYNMQLGGTLHRPDQTVVDAVDDAWDQIGSLEDYDKFTRAWLTEAKRILKPTGSIWVIGSYHNIFRVGYILQDLGFWILNDVIWNKSNPMPNFKGTRLANAHETMIWASSSKDAKFTFNYEAMKAGNEDKQMRSVWDFPICAGAERIKGEDGVKAHSTQKPEALLSRVLLTSTKPGDVVLDPFLGSGTTGAVAKRLNRNFIGIEREEAYLKVALERIDSVEPLSEAVTKRVTPKRELKRVSFLQVVEAKLVEAGAILVNASGNREAVVKPDGTLEIDGKCLSIHKAGALAMGSVSCNGWGYWYLNINGKKISIDQMREKLR